MVSARHPGRVRSGRRTDPAGRGAAAATKIGLNLRRASRRADVTRGEGKKEEEEEEEGRKPGKIVDSSNRINEG